MFIPNVGRSQRLLTRKGTRHFARCLSSRVPVPDAETQPPPQQPFVKTRLEPGEWDPERKDPLYRPKFRSSTRFIAADDFANRPTVGLSADFESLQDGLVTLSWLDQNEQKLIYQLYLDLMKSAEASSGGRTSHEYVMRVIAQKFNITAERVAAVVQLQHNEQQMIMENPDIELNDDLANEMDRLIKQEISDAYQTFNMKKPESFLEDPVTEVKEGKKWTIVNDVFDVDQMAEDAIIREEREARLIIDGYVYVEDVDEESIPIPLDKDCRYLLKQKEVIQKQLAEQETRVHSERKKKTAVEPKWRTKNGEGETRDRYKFVVQTVNTRQLKKSRAKHRSYINNNPENTLVEHNGTLRPANMLDMKVLPWRATRNNMEHIYADAKKGWLDRVNRNMTKSWGRAPDRPPRMKALSPPPLSLAEAAAEFGALPNVDDIPPGFPSVADEMKSSVEVTSDLSASKVAKAEVTPPVVEPVLEASSTPAVDTSVDSNAPVSDSELIAEMNAAEASLEVSPPSIEADPVVSALAEETMVAAEVAVGTEAVVAPLAEEQAADVSAEPVDVVAAPVEEPVVAADVPTEPVDAVAAPVEEPIVAADVPTEPVDAPVEEPIVAADASGTLVDVVASPTEEEPVAAADVSIEPGDVVAAPVEEPTVVTDTSAEVDAKSLQSDFIAKESESKSDAVEAAGELTLNATPSTDLPTDGASSATDTVAAEEVSTALDLKAPNDTPSSASSNLSGNDEVLKSVNDSSPTSDNTLIEDMNAAETSIITASLDHQVDSSVEDQSTVSPNLAADNALESEMSTEAAMPSDSTEETVVPAVDSDAAGLTADGRSDEEPTTVVALETSNEEDTSVAADDSSTRREEEDKPQSNDGHPEKSGDPQDKQ